MATSCRDSGDAGRRRLEKGPAVERIAAASIVWTQYSEDGLQVRIVATANTCPQVLLNGSLIEPAERELVDPAFPAASCTVPVVPGDVVEFGSRRIDVAETMDRVVIIGNPACDPTACDLGPASALAKVAAETEPSLVVVAGNLVADASICLAVPGCDPPSDDRWATWRLRFFDPMKPLLDKGIFAFARGQAHSCSGEMHEGWGHLVATGWYPSNVMCRPVDPTVEIDLADGARMAVMDATAALPPREVPSWMVTGGAELPSGAQFVDFKTPLWIRPADSTSYVSNRGDGVAELLVGPASGADASFWLLVDEAGCWHAERYGRDGATGERTDCLPK